MSEFNELLEKIKEVNESDSENKYDLYENEGWEILESVIDGILEKAVNDIYSIKRAKTYGIKDTATAEALAGEFFELLRDKS